MGTWKDIMDSCFGNKASYGKEGGLPPECQQMILKKPKMRGLLTDQIKRNIPISIILAILGGILFQFFYYGPKKAAYKEFYATYDPCKDLERQMKFGYFQSAPKREES